MKITKLPHLSSSHKIQLLELWNNEYPEKLNYNSLDDFENYLDQLTEQSHFLLIAENNQIKGWYFDFKRMDEKWFVILLASEIQGKGFGTKLLHLAKKKEAELNAWVIDRNTEKKKDGSFYKSPLSFYQKNKFEVLSEIRLELDILSAVKIQWKNRI
jgi:GNAT superfamily N-acetyltransferase